MSHQANFRSEIRGVVSFNNIAQTPIIAVLLEHGLELLHAPLDALPTAFGRRTVIPFSMVSGHSESLEIDPILLHCSDGAADYLVLYMYTGFVTIFAVHALSQGDTPAPDLAPSRKRNRKNTPRSKTFSIGNVVVSSMAVSTCTGTPVIAVLYRDIDFNFSLRYYTFSAHLNSFSMVRQMELFSGAPSRVMAVSTGFLVISDLKLWFFPYHGTTLSLADSVFDPSFPVSHNKLHNVVTLNLAANMAAYLGSRFESSTQIDPNRYLLVSNTGTTLLVYLDTNCTHSTTTVSQFQVVDLGKTTIASDLVHLEENVFYAGSQNSRSAVFRILPQSPFIDIVACVANSSPVLDMNISQHHHKKTLLLTRGGFHSGEVEVVLDSPFRIDRCHVTRAAGPVVGFTRGTGPGSPFVFLQDASGNTVDALKYPSLENPPRPHIYPDVVSHPRPLLVQGSYDKSCWKIDNSRTIECTQSDRMEITLKSERVTTISVENVHQVTSLDWHDNGTSLDVYIASWNGTLAHIRFTSSEASLVGVVCTELQGKISLVRYPRCESQYSIVMLDGEGLIFQMPVSITSASGTCKQTWISESCQYLKAQQSSGTFRMSYTGSHGVLVYDSFSLFYLHHAQDNSQLNLSKLHTFTYPLRACGLTEEAINSGSFLVLFVDGTFSHYSFKNRQGLNDSFNSNDLILSSVNVSGRHTVALQLESKPNMSTGQMETVPSLLLFDRQSLQLLHVYKPRQPSNFVAMTTMSGKYTLKNQSYVVVANSVEDPQEILKVFRVKSNKIEPVSNISLSGMLPKSFSFSGISCNKNTVCVVGDVFLTFTLALSKDSKSEFWRGNVFTHDDTPFFAADVDGSDDFWVLADAVRGLFVACPSTLRLCSLSNPFSTSFATAVAVLRQSPIIIYGDSLGNIWAVKKTADWDNGASESANWTCDGFFDSLFHANICEQINDIAVLSEDPITILFATVKGNVYRVQHLKEYTLAGEYLEKVSEERAMHLEKLSDEETEFLRTSSNLVDARAPGFVDAEHTKKCPDALKVELVKLRRDVESL
ncbi:hypothetical protein JCM33374_g1879 [Metschnikowia sp. JCM 33374]|nr:hypothetical protein JCM33374_g1879 [Metschnikowia sp. JCM 33374]